MSVSQETQRALSRLIKQLESEGLDYNISIPIRLYPILVTSNHKNHEPTKSIAEFSKAQVIKFQYQEVSKLSNKSSIVSHLKSLKEVDSDFTANTYKYLTERGFSKESIGSIIEDCNKQDNIDYSLIRILNRKNATRSSV